MRILGQVSKAKQSFVFDLHAVCLNLHVGEGSVGSLLSALVYEI